MNAFTHDNVNVGDDDILLQLIENLIGDDASLDHFSANASGEGDAAAGPAAAPGYYHAGPHPNHANQHTILPSPPDAVQFNGTSADGDDAAGPAAAPGYYHASPHPNHANQHAILLSPPDAVQFNGTSADDESRALAEDAKLNIGWNLGFGDSAKEILSNNEYMFNMKATLVLSLAVSMNIFPQSNAHFFLSKLMIVLVYECYRDVEKTCLNDTIKYLNKISISPQQMEFHVTDKNSIKPFAATATWRDSRSKKKLKYCDRVAATAQALFWLVSADGSGGSLRVYMRAIRLLTNEQLGKLNNATIAANAAAKIMVVDKVAEELNYADDPRSGSLGRMTKKIMHIVSIFSH